MFKTELKIIIASVVGIVDFQKPLRVVTAQKLHVRFALGTQNRFRIW